MIEESLKQLGLGEKEVMIYLAILQKGKVSPAVVAQLTKINRTTVYSIAKDLIRKGFITEDSGDKARSLVALSPQDLKQLVAKDERELENKKKLVDQTVAELQAFTKDVQYSIPKVHFVYEEELEDYLYKQFPVWNEQVLKADKVWWGYQAPSFVEHYQKWIDWYWHNAPQEISLCLISNQSKIEKEMKRRKYVRRQIKFWDKGDQFTATTWVAGNYLIMTMTDQRPYYLVEIYDRVLASNMRTLFKGIWEELT